MCTLCKGKSNVGFGYGYNWCVCTADSALYLSLINYRFNCQRRTSSSFSNACIGRSRRTRNRHHRVLKDDIFNRKCVVLSHFFHSFSHRFIVHFSSYHNPITRHISEPSPLQLGQYTRHGVQRLTTSTGRPWTFRVAEDASTKHEHKSTLVPPRTIIPNRVRRRTRRLLIRTYLLTLTITTVVPSHLFTPF